MSWNLEGKSAFGSRGPIRPALNSAFRGMKRLGVFLLPPGWDASPSQGYPPALNSPVPICTPGWREALWELSVLPKNTTQCPRPGLEPWNLSLIWHIFVRPLALPDISKKRQGIRGGSQALSCGCQWVKGEGESRHVWKWTNSFIQRTRWCNRHVVFEKHSRITWC